VLLLTGRRKGVAEEKKKRKKFRHSSLISFSVEFGRRGPFAYIPRKSAGLSDKGGKKREVCIKKRARPLPEKKKQVVSC